jgi:hypothetical protein
MKKLLTVVLLLIAVVAAGFAQQKDSLSAYEYMYENAATHVDQLGILQQAEQADLDEAGGFYAKALNRLVMEYPNVKGATEKRAAAEQGILLAKHLGAEKYSQAADDLLRLFEEFSEAPVKAEALAALGSIQATQYLPQVIRVLESLNLQPTRNREYGNQVAYGAIIALEHYGDPSGYLPVYFASKGWYEPWVKEQAVKSLPIISSDPSDYMKGVIRDSGNTPANKYNALQALQGSQAGRDSKAEVAVVALSYGWNFQTNVPKDKRTLEDLRKFAIAMIGAYGASDDSVYALLEKSYEQGTRDEKIRAIKTLAQLASDESAQRLAKFLRDLNARRQSGNIKQLEEEMVREIIPALGQAGRKVGDAALRDVTSLDWTPHVKKLAQDARKQIADNGQ